jgi:histidine triad (HIT) family protein
VYEDEVALAFLDIQPVNPGHTLIIPKRHAAFLGDLDEATGAHLFKIAMRIVAALRRSDIRCEGVNLFLADGEAACGLSRGLPRPSACLPALRGRSV